MRLAKTRDVKTPTRANSTDAGIDFFIPNTAMPLKIYINMQNVGREAQQLQPGDKIVQFALLQLGNPIVTEVKEQELYTSVSDRGEGALGSSGTK